MKSNRKFFDVGPGAIPNSIGQRIKFLRGRLSQEKLAKGMGIGRNTVQLWESNRGLPDTKNLCKFREAFGVNMNWLLTGEGRPFVDAKRTDGGRIDPESVTATATRILESGTPYAVALHNIIREFYSALASGNKA